MTDSSRDGEITTTKEFEEALKELVTAATRNDIDLRGSWVYENTDDGFTDWEVLIYELD